MILYIFLYHFCAERKIILQPRAVISQSLIRNHSLWFGTSGTKPYLVAGENVTRYRYTTALGQAGFYGDAVKVSDFHPGDPGSIPVRVRSEEFFFACYRVAVLIY